MVGKTDILNQAISVIGNAKQKLLQVQMLPVFIGIGLGVLLGSIPFYIPGFPVAVLTWRCAKLVLCSSLL